MNIFVRHSEKCHEKQDYYHAFNHGAHATPLFHDKEDFERFLTLLYIANNTGHFILRDMKTADIFATMRMRALVDIALIALCLTVFILSYAIANRMERSISSTKSARLCHVLQSQIRTHWHSLCWNISSQTSAGSESTL